MIELIIPLIIGILSGTITGLIPGIHINLIAIFILAISFIQNLPTTTLLIFLTAMAITHTFIDFIPAIFLGAPNEDTCLGTLPGHELLLEGKGHHALKLTLLGSTIAIISLILIIPIFIILMPKLYPFIQRMMGFSLIWIAIFLIYNEKKSKIKAILIFTLAGFLGLSSFNLGISQPLLPLLTGLFGTSTIIHSIKSKTILPPQKIEKLKIDKKEIIKPTIATILISPICSFFPGLGSSQAAIIGSTITKKLNREQFLILLGSINTLVMSISFVTLYLFQKSRTGTAFAISQITSLTTTNLVTILATIIMASLLTIPLSLKISKIIATKIHKIPYTKISTIILIFLIIITTYFTGIQGLIILTTATALGLTCIEFQTRRSFLMSAILIPTIIFYLPF
ncbi:tripartite tricarboxylate transporter permease [Candidatus Pacearchaeota archaeon]|nr:tripartite tricarboxylate transporter permease [Candidatus Pacearchaeota archaeon]